MTCAIQEVRQDDLLVPSDLKFYETSIKSIRQLPILHSNLKDVVIMTTLLKILLAVNCVQLCALLSCICFVYCHAYSLGICSWFADGLSSVPSGQASA